MPSSFRAATLTSETFSAPLSAPHQPLINAALCLLPIDSGKISAGFPSPAADYEERRLTGCLWPRLYIACSLRCAPAIVEGLRAALVSMKADGTITRIMQSYE